MKKVFNKFNHLMICAVLLFTLAFTFSGCSENENVQLSIPVEKLLAAITENSGSTESEVDEFFDITVSISGDYTLSERKSGTLSELMTQSFLFANFEADKTITVTIKITCLGTDGLTIESYTGNGTITLEQGENTLNITLSQNTTDSSVNLSMCSDPQIICKGGSEYNKSGELTTAVDVTDTVVAYYKEDDTNGLVFSITNSYEYENFTDAVYSWKINGCEVSTSSKEFVFNSSDDMYDITKGSAFKLNLRKDDKNVLTLTIKAGDAERSAEAICFVTKNYTN